MAFLRRIFKNNNRIGKKQSNAAIIAPELAALNQLGSFMDSLTDCEHYVAKSEYKNRLLDDQKIVSYFQVLKSSEMLENFCKQNHVNFTMVENIISQYENFETIIDLQNEQYIKKTMIKEKDYLDNILNECDPKIKLDEDQRRVVISDEDFSLVVAGAGAGKTTTVAAKVKYLVEKQSIDPKQILVISFTNKAVNELKQRIIGELHIDCPIATFHSTGNAILHKQNPDKLNIVDSSKLYYVIQDYFRVSVLKKESTVNNLILFFASYFDAPYEGGDLNGFFNNIAKSNLYTMRSELNDFQANVIDIRTKKSVTIQSEIMRSNQEVEIANFLYLNCIDYPVAAPNADGNIQALSEYTHWFFHMEQ